MKVELYSGIEAGRLLRRDPGKYFNGIKGLYLLSLVNCELGQVARASYFFMRHIDDVLDGDRHDIPHPLEYIVGLRSQVVAGEFRNVQTASELVKYAISALEQRARLEDNPRQDFLDAIDSVVFDYRRSQNRQALSEAELSNYYQRTFSPVVNLMLIGLKSNLRVSDVPELVQAQGRIYSIRDLEDDWIRGTINIPQEVLSSSSLSLDSPLALVQASPYVQEWITNEFARSSKELELLNDKLSTCSEWVTVRMCNGLINPLKQFIKNNTSVSLRNKRI